MVDFRLDRDGCLRVVSIDLDIEDFALSLHFNHPFLECSDCRLYFLDLFQLCIHVRLLLNLRFFFLKDHCLI